MKENQNPKEDRVSESVFGAAELAVSILAFALIISAALLGHSYL